MLYNIGEIADAGESDFAKRKFLLGVGAVLGVAALAGTFGRVLIERAKRVVAGRDEVTLPSASEPLPGVPEAANFEVEGLEQILVPNEDFYRIDTALSIPRINLQEWTLSITGLVDRE
jgi:DMSO/TMAO reductase YedYZ molybdopterin-dependent catalytic subunit